MMMNIIVGLVLLLFIYTGYRDGFIYKLLSLLSFFVCGILLWFISGAICEVVKIYPMTMLPQLEGINEAILYASFNRLLIFLVLFVITQVILMILRPMAKMISKIPLVGLVNKLLGMIFGAIQGLLMIVVLAMLLMLPIFENGSMMVKQSVLKYTIPVQKYVYEIVDDPAMLQQISIDDIVDIQQEIENMN